jgi:hypothetical protein
LTNIPEIGTIINLDRTIYVCFVLEENGIFFFIGSRWWKWGLVINDAVTCQNSYELLESSGAMRPYSLQSSTSFLLGASPA